LANSRCNFLDSYAVVKKSSMISGGLYGPNVSV
jgi:hypothetical protein